MNAGTTEVFLAHVFTRHSFHHFRAGEEHVGDAFEHHDEVGEGGRVDSTTGTRTADARNLGNNTRGFDVALEDVGKSGQSIHTLLDARTARVVQADAGCAHLHRLVHHLANLFGHCLRQRTAVDGEVLGIDIDQTAVDGGAAAHHAVAEELLLLHAEVVAAMELEHVHFFKTAFVHEQSDTLTSRGLTFGVLLVDGHFATAEACFLTKLNELLDFFQLFTHIVDVF